MGTMRILTLKDGDRAVVWAPDQAEEVEKARTEFDARISEGYRAYEFPGKNREGTPTETFNPDADEIIVTSRGGFAGG